MARDSLAMATGNQIIVIGHSMGARVALEIYRLAPHRIQALALYDTGAHGLREGKIKTRQAAIKHCYEQGMQALADRWLPPMLHPDHCDLPAIYTPLEKMVLSKSPEIHERQITALIGRPDAFALLGEIICPVLLAAGSHDRWSPPAQHLDMQHQITAPSKFSEIGNSGHFAPFEQPDASLAILTGWLDKLAGH